MKLSTILFVIGIIISGIFITSFAISYFSESVFYVNLQKYNKDKEHGNMISYHAVSAPSIEVQVSDQNRKVFIDGDEHSINRFDHNFSVKYEVIYPSGHKYEVVDNSGMLITYDVNGKILSGTSIAVYSVNKRITQDNEEKYFPSSLVTAAYPEYHTKQGNLLLFILSFVLLIYGWCGYKYQKFQRFLFIFSPRWIWGEDDEPSDFYYFMCKFGGIVVIIASLVFLIQSF
jgi:hypothetical protein